MRLAFQNTASDGWAAGDLFLEGMLLALRAQGDDCPALVLVADASTPEADYRNLAARVDEVLIVPRPDEEEWARLYQSLRRHTKWWLRHKLLKLPIPIKPHPLTDLLTRHHIDGYFTKAAAEVTVKAIPSVVWIPDFQHVHLPELYTPDDRAGRDRIFRAQIRAAARVLVTAEAVRQDLEAFAPEQAAKVRCVGFVAHVPEDAYRDDPREGLARYHLPDRFIYLPNQFWQHKNHSLVFEALARLAARGVQPCLVSTGNPLDYRRPAYFSELMQQLSQANLRQQFIILGHVPRADVFRLMRQAVCVLNPSRFEGFGMSVGESKSLGKRVLASDLGPLREQAAPGAVYFDPADADDLAAKLETAWLTWPAGPDQAMETAARAELPRRQAAFGRQLFSLFSEARAAADTPA
jgi:glycosyltransferase involved in cell wall biosynthesis